MKRRRQGFTLLEILLALAIFSLLAAGMATWLASLTEIWEPEEKRDFDEHAWVATRRVEGWLRAAQQPNGGPARLQAGQWADQTGFRTEALVVDHIVDLFGRPTTEPARGALVLLPKRGLVTVRLGGTGDGTVDVISPWVQEVWFDYEGRTGGWESKRAAALSNPTAETRVPRRVRLHFRRGDEEVRTVITLRPMKQEGGQT